MHACMHGLTIASRPHDWMKSKSDTRKATKYVDILMEVWNMVDL